MSWYINTQLFIWSKVLDSCSILEMCQISWIAKADGHWISCYLSFYLILGVHCGLMPFVTSVHHWIKWCEPVHKFILLSVTFPDGVWAEKSGLPIKLLWNSCVLAADIPTCTPRQSLLSGVHRYRVPSLLLQLPGLTTVPREPALELSPAQGTQLTHPQPLRQLLLLSSHSSGELRHSEEELKVKSSSVPEHSKAGLVWSKCTNSGDGSCSVQWTCRNFNHQPSVHFWDLKVWNLSRWDWPLTNKAKSHNCDLNIIIFLVRKASQSTNPFLKVANCK